ncbi:hypothetical protein JXA05_03345 [Candidatus Peregrinibacteria bacterium]|nr:hypothetical protein [Candidatus Peregrinibacteria bacterium]
MPNFLDHIKTHKWGYLLGALVVAVIAIQVVYKPIDFNMLRGDLTGSVAGATTPTFKIQLPTLKAGEYFEKDFMPLCEGCLRGSDIKLQNGALPEGLQMENGYLKGKPAQTGFYEFGLMLMDEKKTFLMTVE